MFSGAESAVPDPVLMTSDVSERHFCILLQRVEQVHVVVTGQTHLAVVHIQAVQPSYIRARFS